MPVSVNYVDINGDGLPDLVTAWPSGYLCAYMNSGTKTEPKFTYGEILPVFLSKVTHHETGWVADFVRKAPRINFFDWNRRGVLDLVMGNYKGEIIFIPNTGTATTPDFRQPKTTDAVMVPTSKNLWANLFAPLAYDFDKDGKTDLVVGEGSYSANAIHLLLNKGTTLTPKFSDDARFYLAYGDGREQLVPALADYNGDGSMDLLVADREGKVGVYLNPGASWKPGVEFKFSSYVTFGGKEELGGAIAPYAADYNGDGLFDLIFGKTNGRIAVAINRGTKEQPKFDAPVEIKGVNQDPSRFNIPSGWSMDCGFRNANAYAYFSCVNTGEDKDSAPPEGQRALKMGYFDCPNKVFKKPAISFPAEPYPWGEFVDHDHGWRTRGASEVGLYNETGVFILRQNWNKGQEVLKVGGNYELSFKVKGHAAREARWTIVYMGYHENAPEKIERGERGMVKKTYDITTEEKKEWGNISAGQTWTTVTHTFSVRFKAPQLKNPDYILSVFEIRCLLPPPDGALYVDDVKLVRKN